MQNITNIKVTELYPHPDNPRKDLGDLAELADSIRQNGIMQNLTVMAGHYNGYTWLEDGYTVLIGHRRLAAAKEAGLEKVPCAEIEADRKDQVAIMLAENMQREDLTAPEQAYGFQMMFDFGCSAENISERTGFSKTTVYHRLNMAKLDKQVLEEQTKELQLTIKDLEALEQIKDVEKRNEVLRDADNADNLHYLIRTEITNEKNKKIMEMLFEKAKKEGMSPAPKTYKNRQFDYEDIFTLYLRPLTEQDIENVEFDLKGRAAEDLFYGELYGSFIIVALKSKTKEEDEEKQEPTAKEIWDRKRIASLNALTTNSKAKIIDFLESLIEQKMYESDEGNLKAVMEFYFDLGLCSLHGIIEHLSKKSYWALSMDEREEYERDATDTSIESRVYMLVKERVQTWSDVPFTEGSYNENQGIKRMKVVTYLKRFGFSLNIEEQMVLRGTSYLFDETDPDAEPKE